MVTPGPLDHLQLTFDRPMDETSFSLEEDIAEAESEGEPLTITEAVWLNDNRTLELRFDPITDEGSYAYIVLGAQISDLWGNELDQDRDLIPGEEYDDWYWSWLVIGNPPRVVSQAPTGSLTGPVSSVRIDFSSPMDITGFDPESALVAFTGPSGPVTVTGYSWGETGESLELRFEPQTAAGHYEIVLGPQIPNAFGLLMDQNGNSTSGEVPGDRYTGTFDIAAGPRVSGHTPSGDQTDPVSQVTVTFNGPIDPATFTVDDVTIVGPAGNIAVSGAPTHLTGNDYRIQFAEQSLNGPYHVYVGPHIADMSGQKMDQDCDLIVGEDPDDRYDAAFTRVDVKGPRITGATPAQPVQAPLDHLDVTFSEAIRAESFDPADVVITGPAGAIAATGVEPLDAEDFPRPLPGADGGRNLPLRHRPGDPGWGVELDGPGQGRAEAEPHDQYTAVVAVDMSGPVVTAHSLTDVQNNPVRSFELTFNEEINPATFTAALVTVAGPEGSKPAEKVEQVAVNRFRVKIPGVAADATFRVTVAPAVADVAGNPLAAPYEFEFVQRLPDLVVTGSYYPEECVPGQRVDFQWTVTNQGLGAASGTWTDVILLSPNAQGTDAVEVGRLPFNWTVAPGASYTRADTFAVPADARGSYWVVVRTDALDQLPEVGGANNDSVRTPPLTVTQRAYPDLQVTDVAAPLELNAGEASMIAWTVRNAGTGATSAGAWKDGIFLSADATLDPADVRLASVRNPDFLAIGESYRQTQEVTIPSALLGGSYYVLVVADVDKQVQEFDLEDNNAAAAGQASEIVAPPPPVMSVTDVQAHPPSAPDEYATFTWTITNTGGTTITTGWAGNGWDDGLALSRDAVYQVNQDYWLGSHTYWNGLPLAPGKSYTSTGTAEHPIPPWAPGDYYVIVIPDTHWGAGSGFGQSTIARDYGVLPVRIEYSLPDLVPVSLTAPGTGVAGQKLAVQWRVENHDAGPTRAAQWTDEVYLSSDNVLDAGDVRLGSAAQSGPLYATAGYERTAQVKIPANTPEGRYYVFVKTDVTNAVVESSETNNVLGSAGQVEIVHILSDLQAVAAQGPATGTAGAAVSVSWSVQNTGRDATDAGRWTDAVYLSAIPAFDPAQARRLQAFVHTGALAPLGQYDRTEAVPLPAEIEGTYYLFLVIDAEEDVFEESGEENNVCPLGTSLVIADPAADLAVQQFIVPVAPVAGEPLNVTWRVLNQGEREAVPAWQDAVYLSADETLDPKQDRQVGTVDHTAAVAVGQDYQVDGGLAGLRLPDDIEGRYYLFLVVDSGAKLYEKRRLANNVTMQPIDIVDRAPDSGGQLAHDARDGDCRRADCGAVPRDQQRERSGVRPLEGCALPLQRQRLRCQDRQVVRRV